jgi:low temperature requirement protein LtrA
MLERRQLWRRPQLRTDEEEDRERRVSWLELFYDLVFVVVIAEVAHYLSSHISPAGVVGYVLLFLPVWWVWIGGTFYTERFETEDLSYRLFTFFQMIPVAAMAVFAYQGLDETAAGYGLAYAAARTVITVMWARAGLHAPAFRPVAKRFVFGFCIAILLFALSAFVEPPLRFALWGLGLLIDLLTPAFTLNLQRQLPRFSSSKLPERFGLFVIIVLGEAIVGVVLGVAELREESALSLTTYIESMLGLTLAFGLWWVYFDFLSLRKSKPGIWWSFAWNYFHLPLVMALAAIGAGVLAALTAENAPALAASHALLAGATGIALIAIGLIELTLMRSPYLALSHRMSIGLKFGMGAVALILTFIAGALETIPLLIILCGLVAVEMIYGTYAWLRSAPGAEHAVEASAVQR